MVSPKEVLLDGCDHLLLQPDSRGVDVAAGHETWPVSDDQIGYLVVGAATPTLAGGIAA